MQLRYNNNNGLVKCKKKKKCLQNTILNHSNYHLNHQVRLYQRNILICQGGCGLVLDLPNRARGERHIETGAQRYLFCCDLPASRQTSSSSCPKEDKQQRSKYITYNIIQKQRITYLNNERLST